LAKTIEVDLDLTGEGAERRQLKPMRTHLGHLSQPAPDGVESIGEQGGL
jgi:hypothetical protein